MWQLWLIYLNINNKKKTHPQCPHWGCCCLCRDGQGKDGGDEVYEYQWQIKSRDAEFESNLEYFFITSTSCRSYYQLEHIPLSPPPLDTGASQVPATINVTNDRQRLGTRRRLGFMVEPHVRSFFYTSFYCTIVYFDSTYGHCHHQQTLDDRWTTTTTSLTRLPPPQRVKTHPSVTITTTGRTVTRDCRGLTDPHGLMG